MAVKLKCLLACVTVLAEIAINPQDNTFTNEEFATLSANNDFKQLKRDGKIFILDQDEDETDEPEKETDPTKMKVGELRTYATELGIEFAEGATKAEILKLIELASE